jgi:hypothetical protein
MTFWMGFGEKNRNIYQKTPSPETDQAWEDLYNGGQFLLLAIIV